VDLGLRPTDRVLVFGASGWFGRELRALLARNAITSKVLWVPGPSSPAGPSETEIAEFQASVVVNFAALTRERVAIDGEAPFMRTNELLTRRFHQHAEASGVRLAVTVSSGAAVTEPDHPYGRMKAAEEKSALELAESGRSVVVMRAYSVSGGYVRRPRDYAFSDFIIQAASGEIRVSAASAVFRRYCSVQDALFVALQQGADGRSGLFETGGEYVEMGGLAAAIVSSVNPQAVVTRPTFQNEAPTSYCSDNSSWSEWSLDAGLRPADLQEQISQAAAVLLTS